MRSPQRWRVVVVTAVMAVLVIAAGGAMAEDGSGPSQVTVGQPTIGQPWTGAAGIERTVSEIMAAQRAKGAIQAPRAIREREADHQLVPSPASPAGGPAPHNALPGPKALTVGSSFTGATLASDSIFVPPDSMGAVGPTQFLVGVNGRIRVFSKTGTAGTLNATLDTFFASVLTAGAFTTDPRVRYDPLSGKWFVSAIDTGDSSDVNNRILLAVSSGSTIDNSTVWTFFQFRQDVPSPTGDANDFADFDTLGIDANALYIGANIFDSNSNFVNTTGFVIRKSSVMGGGPIVVTAFRHLLDNSGNGPYTPQGVDNLDPAATEGYFVGVDDHFFGILDVRRVGSPGGTPTLSGNLAVSVPSDDRMPISVPAMGASRALDAIDWRLGTASIRNGKLYTAQNIGVDASGAGSASPSRDAVRWYELANLTTTPTLSRSGTIFDDTANALSYWMPSIAVNGQGHAVIGTSTGGASARPNAAVSSMLSSDSSFSAPTNYTSSSANYGPSFDTGPSPLRWGDYSNTSVDPCDGQTFWTIQEYVDGTNSWGVKVGKVAAPPPATPASASPSTVAGGQASVSVTLTGTSSAGSGFWDPGSGSCRIGASVDGSVTVNSVTFVDATHVTLDISTVGATGGAHNVTITNPDGQTASASVLTVGSAPSSSAAPAITGTAALRSALTANDGTWNGVPTPTLTRKWRRCDQSGASCADIGGATGTTYTLVQADVASTIRLRVTATNGNGSASADSAQTAIVTGPPVSATPTISGSAIVGQTLTANPGPWGGYPAPAFTYQWQSCSSGGLNCTNIASATATTYTPVTADVGSTLRVNVSASNSGGAAGPVSSAVTAAVVTAPSGGGGGGGGGGGSGGLPDVVIGFNASPAAPGVGDTLVYSLTAAIKTGNASDVKATVNLPAQVSFVSAATNRGPGCTGTTTLTCDVDFLSGNLVAQVTIVTTVTATGTLTATASLTSTPADSNTADNSATVTTTVGAPAPPPPPPPPPSKTPVMKQLGSRTLSGVPSGPNESFAARFSTNERMRVSMTVTKSRTTRKLSLLKGSGLAGTTASSSRLTLTGVARGAGGFSLKAVLKRSGLVKGALYVVHLTAVDANGKKTALNISFRAR